MAQEGELWIVQGRNLSTLWIQGILAYQFICFYIQMYLVFGYWTGLMVSIATWKSYLPGPRSLNSLNPTLFRVSFNCNIWDRPGFVSDLEHSRFEQWRTNDSEHWSFVQSRTNKNIEKNTVINTNGVRKCSPKNKISSFSLCRCKCLKPCRHAVSKNAIYPYRQAQSSINKLNHI